MNRIKNKIQTILIVASVLQFSNNRLVAQYTDDYEISMSEVKNSVQFKTPGSSILKGIGNGNVELYTGRASYTVPVYKLKSLDIEVPITLSYISAGVKIQQVADWVGIDWNIQPGGIIRREVKGLPDELPDKGYLASSGKVDDFLNDVYNKDQKEDVINNKDLDYQPDIFHFKAGKYSGSFMFDGGWNIHFFPYQNIKASTIRDTDSKKIIGFTLTTPDGIIYEFGNSGALIEETLIETETHDRCDDVEHKILSGDFFNSAWYLHKIESPSGDWTEFTYSDVKIIKYVDAVSTTKYQWERDNYNGGKIMHVDRTYVYFHDDEEPTVFSSDWLKYEKNVNYPYVGIHNYVNTQNRYEIKRRYLNGINCKTGTSAIFTVQYNRSDLPAAGKLSSIEILNNLGNQIKKINLDYTAYASQYLDPICRIDPFSETEMTIIQYIDVNFEDYYGLPANQGINFIDLVDGSWSLDIENFIKEGLKHYNYHRLFLTKVTEVKNTETKSTLDFTYINPDELQRRTTNYVDFYGYNLTSLPKKKKYSNNRFQYTSSYPYSSPNDYVETDYEEVRKQKENPSRNGLLEKVESSFGETIEYYYENNENGAGSRVSELRRVDGNNSYSTFYDYFKPEIAKVEYQDYNWFYNEYDVSYGDYSACSKFMIRIRSSNNLSTENSLYNGSQIIYDSVEVYRDMDRKTGHNIFEFYNVTGSTSEINESYSPKIKYDEPWTRDVVNQYGVGDVSHYYQNYLYDFNPGNPFGFSGINYYLNNSFKRGILYKSTFKNSNDQSVKEEIYNYTFNLVPSNETGTKINGLIGTKFKVGLQWNTYTEPWPSLALEEWALMLKDGYIATIYSLTPESYQLTSKVEKTYDNNHLGEEAYALINTTNYTYNEYNQVSSVSFIDSRGDQIKNYYQYPHDYAKSDCELEAESCFTTCTELYGNSSNPEDALAYLNCYLDCQFTLDECTDRQSGTMVDALRIMREKNIVNPVVEEYQTRLIGIDEYFVGGNLTLYKEFQEGNIKPYKTYVSKNNLMVDIVNFNPSLVEKDASYGDEDFIFDIGYYDEENTYEWIGDNCVQIEVKDDSPNSYIWGYGGLYPIAEAINAKYNDVYFTSFEDEPEIRTWHPSPIFSYARAKTDKTSLKIENSGSEEYYYFLPFRYINNSETKTYKFSAWVYSEGPSADLVFFFKPDITDEIYSAGYQVEEVKTNETGKWVYMKGDAVVPPEMKSIFLRIDNNGGGTVWFDDLKFWEENARMTTYTYDPLIGMTSATGPDNKKTTYEYDDFGRLEFIKDHNDDVVKKYTYHYKGDPTDEVTEDFIDLSVLTITGPTVVYDNETSVDIDVEVSNSGNLMSNSCNLSIYISDDSNLDAGDIKLADRGVASLSNAGNVTNHINVPLPSDLNLGTYYLIAKVDSDNQNDESDESNNTKYATFNYEQEQTEILEVSTTSMTFNSDGNPQSFDITSNISWTITADAWLEILPVSSGSGDQSITVTCINFPEYDRLGIITVSGGGITKTIHVTQLGTGGSGPV